MPTRDEVYRKFGEVAEAAQLLETELGNILLEIKSQELGLFSGYKSEDASEILKNINASTLGTVLTRIRSQSGVLDNTTELFANALASRNRLVHSFYRQHNFRIFSDKGCQVMLKDLEDTHSVIMSAYKAALAVSGIDLDKVVAVQIPPEHKEL